MEEYPVLNEINSVFHLALSSDDNHPILKGAYMLVTDKKDNKIYRVRDGAGIRKFFGFPVEITETLTPVMTPVMTPEMAETPFVPHEILLVTPEAAAETPLETPTLPVGSAEKNTDEQTYDGEFRWERPAVLLLLSTYQNEEPNMNSGKISMKKCWERVSDQLKKEGYNISGPQCKSKMNGMKKVYKTVRDHNNKSGNNRRTWQYFEIMEELFRGRPWVSPVCALQSTMNLSSQQATSPPKKPPKKRAKVSAHQDQILEALNASAVQRAQMHEAAMARQDKLLDILSQLVPKGT